MRATAEVHLTMSQSEIRIELLRSGKVVDQEVFEGQGDRKVMREVARVLFDDAYDLVNYSIDGMEQRRRSD
jgi:hypothetical protein